MKINQLELPRTLAADLSVEWQPLPSSETERLVALLEFLPDSAPGLMGLERMVSENRLWTTPNAKHYVGNPSSTHSPGNIDPKKIVIIGDAGSDEPLALDFRASPPSVVYLGYEENKSYWIKIADSYDDLRAEIRSAG